MDGPCRVRRASSADLPAFDALERASFPDPWTPAQLQDALDWHGTIVLVAEAVDGSVAGYVLGRVIVDEAEVLTLATAPALRRQGVGGALLQAFLDEVQGRGAHAVWLEVRVSNVAARAMYQRAGFVAEGLRKGYYRQPVEDALVLRRDLINPALLGTTL